MGSSSSTAKDKTKDEKQDEELILNETRIETGDQNAVKNLLDDKITEIFQERKDLAIQYGWDNTKLFLMVLASLIAAVSHFYKSPVISERVIVYTCVGGFFAIHALLFAYSVFIEKDILLRATKKGTKAPVIVVRTDFPYTEENYSVSIEYEGQPGKSMKHELYVGRFFDVDGYFDEDAFTNDIKTILSRFEKKKEQ